MGGYLFSVDEKLNPNLGWWQKRLYRMRVRLSDLSVLPRSE